MRSVCHVESAYLICEQSPSLLQERVAYIGLLDSRMAQIGRAHTTHGS